MLVSPFLTKVLGIFDPPPVTQKETPAAAPPTQGEPPPPKIEGLKPPVTLRPGKFVPVAHAELAETVPPPNDVPPTEAIQRGQKVTCTIKDADVRGELAGFDYKGRPVIHDAGGARRIGSWEAIAIEGVELPRHSAVSAIPAGRILRPPPKLLAALDRSFDIEVVGPHRAREYVEAMQAEGYAVYLTGGAIRDALRAHAINSNASVDDLLEKLKDVDIVTTAPPPAVRELCKKIAPEYPDGAVWSPPVVDQFGSVLVGGPKAGLPNPEGLDINCMRSEGAFEEMVDHPDTGEKAHPYTFDHSLHDDAGTRDFTCNALYYDPLNKVLIDPTGRGIRDAEKNQLRISRWSTLENDDNIALRFWKFRIRGFESDHETRKTLVGQAKRTLWAMPRWKLILNVARIAPKDARTPEDVHKFLAKLETVMQEDGAGDLYRRRINPLTDKITKKIVRRYSRSLECASP